MTAKISFNGQEYNSPDEMPPQIRQLYERAMASLSQNQQANLASPKINIKVKTNLRFKYNGQTYNSLDELPPDVRPKYENLVSQVDKDHNGIPDFLEGKSDAPITLPHNTNADNSFGPSALIAPVTQPSPVISSDRPTTRLLIVAGIIIALLLLAIIILAGYIYLR